MDNILSTNFYGYDCEYRSMLDKMHDIHKLITNKEHCNHLMLLEHKSVITYTLQHGTKNIITSKNDIINEGIDLQIADRDRKSTRLNSSHIPLSRMPSSA